MDGNFPINISNGDVSYLDWVVKILMVNIHE